MITCIQPALSSLDAVLPKAVLKNPKTTKVDCRNSSITWKEVEEIGKRFLLLRRLDVRGCPKLDHAEWDQILGKNADLWLQEQSCPIKAFPHLRRIFQHHASLVVQVTNEVELVFTAALGYKKTIICLSQSTYSGPRSLIIEKIQNPAADDVLKPYAQDKKSLDYITYSETGIYEPNLYPLEASTPSSRIFS